MAEISLNEIESELLSLDCSKNELQSQRTSLKTKLNDELEKTDMISKV